MVCECKNNRSMLGRKWSESDKIVYFPIDDQSCYCFQPEEIMLLVLRHQNEDIINPYTDESLDEEIVYNAVNQYISSNPYSNLTKRYYQLVLGPPNEIEFDQYNPDTDENDTTLL
jgi:hypothetical protein